MKSAFAFVNCDGFRERRVNDSVQTVGVIYSSGVLSLQAATFVSSQQETKKHLDSQSRNDRSEHCLAKRRWCAIAPVTTDISVWIGQSDAW